MSVYDISFADNLPSKGIQDIPPADTIIPSIFAKFPPSSSPSSLPSSTPSSTPSTPSSSPTTTTQTAKSTQTAKTAQTAQTAESAQTDDSEQTDESEQTSLVSSLTFQDVSTQDCFDYAKNCRDVQCAFQDFNVICDNKGNGPACTCGTGQTSNSASSIQSNANFAILTIFISFVISFYQFC